MLGLISTPIENKLNNTGQMEWYFKHRKKILIATISYVVLRLIYLYAF